MVVWSTKPVGCDDLAGLTPQSGHTQSQASLPDTTPHSDDEQVSSWVKLPADWHWVSLAELRY